ncbi:hypothetical protein CRV24_008984 [Beauveria bassiana]|nr:hypothetical protein CRV24_008984 [Beauveria bassiana]
MAARGTADAMTATAMDREAVLVAMTVRDTIVKVTVSLAALVNLLREALADMPIPRRAPNPENNTEV